MGVKSEEKQVTNVKQYLINIQHIYYHNIPASIYVISAGEIW